jgi:hypothetical protein
MGTIKNVDGLPGVASSRRSALAHQEDSQRAAGQPPLSISCGRESTASRYWDSFARTVETFGHDDFRNVLYTCDKTDQRLMIARLSLQISWPSQRVWMSR